MFKIFKMTREEFLGVGLSGLLYGFSFITVWGPLHFPETGFLAWVALVPLLLILNNKSPRKVLELCFFTFFIGYALSNFWIYNAMYTYGHLSPLLCLAVMALTFALMSLYGAGAAALSRWIEMKSGAPLLWVFPIFWVIQSWCINYFPAGGYPWSNIAYSQHAFLSLIQVLDLAGIYGLTFLIVFANAVGAALILFLKKQRSFPWQALLVLTFLISLSCLYGLRWQDKVQKALKGANWVPLALLQGNIPQDEKWLEGNEEWIIERHVALTEKATEKGARLVIWPEAAYPYSISDQITRIGRFRTLEHFLLIGAIIFHQDKKESFIHNSALLIAPGGYVRGTHHKTHLVPLGEYIPMRPILGFLKKLVPVIGDIRPGEKGHVIPYEQSAFGTLICYEDIFPEIARAMSREGAEFLVNITNDAWYGETSGPYQHVVFSQYRAIENRKFLVRAANTGISAVIDPFGRVLSSGVLNREELLLTQVALMKHSTLYSRLGDLFVYILIGVGIVLFILSWKESRHVRIVREDQNL